MNSSSESNLGDDYGFLIISAIVSVIIIAVIKPVISAVKHRFNQGSEKEETSDEKGLPIEMCLDELNTLTDKFAQKSVINGCYYGAKLRNGRQVAIKKLDITSSPEENAALLSIVSTLKHENYVTLMGYCLAPNNRIFVYEFATMGSLHDVLHGRKGIHLTWHQRAKIGYSVARGLEYLHEKVESPIIHGQVRSSNVLLFDDFTAKLADFDPSAESEMKTKKGDIYDFAVVLLELLTGRKPEDVTKPEGQQSLVAWATPLLNDDDVKQCVDPNLNNEYPPNAIAKVAGLAGLCLQDEPDFRPNMTIMVGGLYSTTRE